VCLTGLLHIIKLPHLNALTSVDVDTTDLAFKIRRKRFTIEVTVQVTVCIELPGYMFDIVFNKFNEQLIYLG